MKFTRATFVTCLLTMLLTSFSFADTFFETTDAGSTIPSAVLINSNIDQIEGALNSDHDMWGFSISSSQTVQILLGLSNFDDNLLLFDSMGRGLAGNDDIGRGSASPGINIPSNIGGLDSEIVAFLNPGTYYFAVGQNNSYGFTDNDAQFISNDSGLLSNPTTETLGYVGGANGNGSYTVFINRIPEPSSAALLTVASLGLAVVRRRKNCA